MIRNGLITYPGAHSTFRNWRPNQDFLYELIVGSLTTLVIYQASAFIVELGIGFKRRGFIQVSDLGLLILIYNMPRKAISQLFASFSSFFGRSSARSGHAVAFKAMFLVFSISFVRILTTALILENDRDVSFKEAGLEGIALGHVNRPDVDSIAPYKNFDYPIAVDYGPFDVPVAEFYMSSPHVLTSTDFQWGGLSEVNWNETKAIVHMRAGDSESFECSVLVEYHKYNSHVTAHALVRGELYKVRKEMEIDHGKKILEKVVDSMTMGCPSGLNNDIVVGMPPVQHEAARRENGWDLYTVLTCTAYDQDNTMSRFTYIMRKVFPLFDAEISLITSSNRGLRPENSGQEYTAWDDLVLLVRRSGTISILQILLAAVCVLGLRIFLQLFFICNDGILAVDIMVKDFLDIPCCDSILQSEDEVEYKHCSDRR